MSQVTPSNAPPPCSVARPPALPDATLVHARDTWTQLRALGPPRAEPVRALEVTPRTAHGWPSLEAAGVSGCGPCEELYWQPLGKGLDEFENGAVHLNRLCLYCPYEGN